MKYIIVDDNILMITAKKRAGAKDADIAKIAWSIASDTGFAKERGSVFCDIFENGDAVCVFVRKGGTGSTDHVYYSFPDLECFLCACREISHTGKEAAAFTDGGVFYLRLKRDTDSVSEFFGTPVNSDRSAIIGERARPIAIGVKELGQLAI